MKGKGTVKIKAKSKGIVRANADADHHEVRLLPTDSYLPEPPPPPLMRKVRCPGWVEGLIRNAPTFSVWTEFTAPTGKRRCSC